MDFIERLFQYKYDYPISLVIVNIAYLPLEIKGADYPVNVRYALAVGLYQVGGGLQIQI